TGTDKCFACSESRGVELLVFCDIGGISTLLLRTKIDRLDLLRNVLQPARQSSQVPRRAVRIRNRLRNPLPHRHQQRAMITRSRSRSNRKLPRRSLTRLNNPKILPSSHAITSVWVCGKTS